MDDQLNNIATIPRDYILGVTQAHDQSVNKPPTSFPKYPRLAIELRILIIRASIVPRIIEISEERSLFPPRFTSLTCSPAGFQGLSGADQVTRDTLLETHTYKFHSFMENGHPVLINKETDMICFDNYEALHKFASSPNAARLLRPELFDSIAVRYDAYENSLYTTANNYMRDMSLFGALMRAVRGFGSLRKLYILQGEYPEAREDEAVMKMNDLRSYAQNYFVTEKLLWDQMWYETERLNNLTIGQSYRWRVPEIVVMKEKDFKYQFEEGELDI